MADQTFAPAEGIAVNPSQVAFTLANQDKIPTLAETENAIYDTNVTNNAINNTLATNPEWQKYLADPQRFEKEEYRNFAAVERLMYNSLNRPLIEKHGDELLSLNRYAQVYYKPDNWWTKQRMGYNIARYGMNLSEARTKLSDALRSGDDKAIALAQAEIHKQEFNLRNEGYEFETDISNTLASFAASYARNPELLVIAALGGLVSGGIGAVATTTGAGALASGAATAANVVKAVKTAKNVAKWASFAGTQVASAALVRNDSFKVEAGSILEELDRDHPEMSEEQKWALAEFGGSLKADAEAASVLLGAGLVGHGSAFLRRALTRAVLSKSVPTSVLRSPVFIKEFAKSLGKKKTLPQIAGSLALDAATEYVVESYQDSIDEATRIVAEKGFLPEQIASIGEADFMDFMARPLAPEHKEKLDAMLNVFLGASLFGGITAGGEVMQNRNTIANRLNDARKNSEFASRLKFFHDNSGLAKESPETLKEALRVWAASGDAPATVRFDIDAARELIDTDPDVRDAFEKLGVLRQLRETQETGGVVEVALEEYDEVVNGEPSGKLYQKVRDIVAFDSASMTTSEFMRYIQTDANVQGEIAEAQKKANSVYNKTLEIMNTVENMDENTKKMNATIMQLITNRIAGFSIGSPKTAEEVFSKVDILTGQAQPIEVRLPGKPVSQGMDTSAYDIQTPKETTKKQQKEIQKQKQAPSLLRLKDIKSAMKDAGYRNVGAPILSKTAGSESVYAKIYKGEGKDKKVVAQVRVSAHPMTEKSSVPTIVLDGRKSLEENIATLNEELNKLRIEPDDIAAGWFTKESDRLVIALTKETNATAFAHEAFHLFADSLVESYNADALSPYWKSQAEKMFKSVGVKVKDGKAKLTDAQQETLAQDFTTYILQGKVKNQELTSLFAVMKDLFSKLYTKFGWNKSKQLDKNIRDVFNSIFNSQAEIEAEQRILGMLEFEKPEGADQTLYDRYISFLLNSRSKASQKMVKAIFAYEAFKNSEEYKTRYAKEYADAVNTLNESMAYQIKALAATVNNDPALTFAMFSAQHPDAEITVDAIEEILKNTPDMTVEAERMANEAMNDVVLEKFGIDKETFASRALRNADKAKALLAEAMMREGKTWAEFEEEYSKLLRGVENQTSRMTLSKIRNMKYWANQEARLVEQYAYYLATGDMKRAAEARRSQAALTLIRMKGEELDKRITRFTTDFPGKMRFNQKKDTVSAQAWDLMQSILERYGFKITSKRRDPRPVNVKLEEWVADKEKTYFTTIGNMRYFIPAILEGHTGRFYDMQVRKFEEMEHVLKAINSLARDEFRITTEGETTLVKNLVAETIARLDEKDIKPFDQKNGWWAKTFGTISKWTNPEPILNAIFPESVMNKVFRPLFTAASKAENKAQEWSTRWGKIKSKVDLSSKKQTYSNGVKLSNLEVADLLLSMGTQHAYDNFLLKFKITDAQAQVVVAEALRAQPALEKFAKETWALYDETTTALNESYQKRTNQLFVKKEARKFTINGIEFEGGYVPENKGYPTIPNDDSYHSLQMGILSNEKMLEKEADGEVRSIVDNTDSRLYLFARWGYAAAEYNNVCKFMQNDDLRARIGQRADSFVRDWLATYQTPQTDTSGLVRPLASATSLSALGFRLAQGLIQLSGLIPAIGVVGGRYMVRGIRKSMLSTDMFKAIKTAADKSEYMKSRYANPVSSLMGLEAKDLTSVPWLRNAYQKVGMFFITYCDAIVSNATWDAAYVKAVEAQGMSHEEAVLAADAAVRLSQSDSMALSRSQALQSNWARLLTSFSTYIMGMQSLVRGKIAANEKAQAAIIGIGYIVVSTAFEAMLKEPFEDDEDDKKWIERVERNWYNQFIGTLGSTVVPALGIGQKLAQSISFGVEKAVWDSDDPWTETYRPTVSALDYMAQGFTLIQNLPSAIAGDEDAQMKALLNSIGLFSQGGKRKVKEWMNE